MREKIERATDALIESYTGAGIKIHHLDFQPLPSHAEIIRVLVTIHELLFPGYIGKQELTAAQLRSFVEARMTWLQDSLTEQLKRAICHGTRVESGC
ncbi:MAG: hypothetical protein ICV68_01660, partial [Pyrinomonadaceae bacterium]|nr:hypothetical protein [Pyrinomonadaceae bacterium]